MAKQNKKALIEREMLAAVAFQDQRLRADDFKLPNVKRASPKVVRLHPNSQPLQILTIEQELGWEPKPEILTEADWKEIDLQSKNRKDATFPCAICKERFGVQEQVLLSCSHTFHSTCLSSYERFSKSKTCPLCRKERYLTRKTKEGYKVHRVDCSTKYVLLSFFYFLRTHLSCGSSTKGSCRDASGKVELRVRKLN
eukprot:TRINITY_DN7083_c0_g1_i2.p1 TRINITY_DN7083_c0_g1~~TRINITY_DN7083_c0_g1_i2.p1  ORF type:complete len:197 (-),score=4.16 TRINITY_DN7083_c0_g1_i2:99-689(-)